MSTLVFHSSTLGVTEYSTTFTGLAGDYEATADAVHSVGGVLDVAALIPSSFSIGINATKDGLKRVPISAHLQADTASVMRCDVTTPNAGPYAYAEDFRSGRTHRFTFGRGIRDAYLGFRFYNPDGLAFRVDHIGVLIETSKQRKV